jgi:hypothetical protein
MVSTSPYIRLVQIRNQAASSEIIPPHMGTIHFVHLSLFPESTFNLKYPLTTYLRALQITNSLWQV